MMACLHYRSPNSVRRKRERGACARWSSAAGQVSEIVRNCPQRVNGPESRLQCYGAIRGGHGDRGTGGHDDRCLRSMFTLSAGLPIT